jgi:hypothetical protein
VVRVLVSSLYLAPCTGIFYPCFWKFASPRRLIQSLRDHNFLLHISHPNGPCPSASPRTQPLESSPKTMACSEHIYKFGICFNWIVSFSLGQWVHFLLAGVMSSCAVSRTELDACNDGGYRNVQSCVFWHRSLWWGWECLAGRMETQFLSDIPRWQEQSSRVWAKCQVWGKNVCGTVINSLSLSLCVYLETGMVTRTGEGNIDWKRCPEQYKARRGRGEGGPTDVESDGWVGTDCQCHKR